MAAEPARASRRRSAPPCSTTSARRRHTRSRARTRSISAQLGQAYGSRRRAWCTRSRRTTTRCSRRPSRPCSLIAADAISGLAARRARREPRALHQAARDPREDRGGEAGRGERVRPPGRPRDPRHGRADRGGRRRRRAPLARDRAGDRGQPRVPGPGEGDRDPREPRDESLRRGRVGLERRAGTVGRRMKRYHVTTFGCQMNAHDSERIKGMLESLGIGESPSRTRRTSSSSTPARSARSPDTTPRPTWATRGAEASGTRARDRRRRLLRGGAAGAALRALSVRGRRLRAGLDPAPRRVARRGRRGTAGAFGEHRHFAADLPPAPRAAVPGVGAGLDGLQLGVRLLHRPGGARAASRAAARARSSPR